MWARRERDVESSTFPSSASTSSIFYYSLSVDNDDVARMASEAPTAATEEMGPSGVDNKDIAPLSVEAGDKPPEVEEGGSGGGVAGGSRKKQPPDATSNQPETATSSSSPPPP